MEPKLALNPGFSQGKPQTHYVAPTRCVLKTGLELAVLPAWPPAWKLPYGVLSDPLCRTGEIAQWVRAFTDSA